jgi:hypothetical protein
MIKKTSIVVWDYSYSCQFCGTFDEYKPPKKLEVDAICVGGEFGIMAYFFLDNMLYEAHGDDGHWWVSWKCHKDWLGKIKEAVSSLEVPDESLDSAV